MHDVAAMARFWRPLHGDSAPLVERLQKSREILRALRSSLLKQQRLRRVFGP